MVFRTDVGYFLEAIPCRNPDGVNFVFGTQVTSIRFSATNWDQLRDFHVWIRHAGDLVRLYHAMFLIFMLNTVSRRRQRLELKRCDFSTDEYIDDEKYLFLLLFAPGRHGKFNEKITGDIWLQKQMFLLKEILPKISLPFTEHHYGAFSPALDVLKKQNAISGLICQQNDDFTGKLWLLKEGIETAEMLWDSIPDQEKSTVSSVKEFMNDMDMWELISYFYSTFPETTQNSDVVDKFKEKRLNSACSLFSKNKISLKKAASVAGLSLDDFISELKQRGIPSFKIDITSFQKSLTGTKLE